MAALRRYKVSQEQIEAVGNVTAILKRVVGGREKVIDTLRFSEDPTALQFIETYDESPIGDRNYLPFEAICIKAGIPPSALLGAVVMASKRLMGQESALITIMEHPEVVRKTIQYAKELPGASKDREMVHQATGWLPSKNGGGQVNVNLMGGVPQNPPRDGDDDDETIDGDDDNFNEAFPSVNRELEAWGTQRRGLLEKGR